MLQKFFEINFWDVDEYYPNFYDGQCITLVNQQEYQQEKQKFVKNWIEDKLDNKADLDQSLAIGLIKNHIQVIARAGSGKTSTLVKHPHW